MLGIEEGSIVLTGQDAYTLYEEYKTTVNCKFKSPVINNYMNKK